MKFAKLFVLVPIVLVVVIGLYSSYFMLDNAEEAVIERFGKLNQVESEAGLHFKVPFIDHVTIFNTNEVISLQYGYRPASDPTTTSYATYDNVESEAIVLTKGSYLVNIGAVIQYRITDPAAYYYNVDDQDGTIRLAFESVLRRNIQNQDLDSALINKDSIAREILPDLTQKLNSYDLGITITEVKLTDVLLPDDVQYAYDDVNIANNEKESYKSQAEKYSNEMLPKARADAYQLIQEAEAYKAEKVAQAKGDVENFNQVYEKYKVSKDITKTRLYIETMEKILGKVSDKYIVDIDSDNILKFLPLETNGGQ
ncbi:FtsH protease activity modulator HflK [Fusibacter paucivorans]|uniref:Protein HflK n=1 Tax=Fusibacter paucivorans TaxID=76009 RepID=A0ABS5PKN8_9FIRM|nr:FtsH protease activity modulator HflK [Fusibacter paucivorans]MBS7525704.1 FtsH protease activity modulator HflK [Fusibacter paucivorans]